MANSVEPGKIGFLQRHEFWIRRLHSLSGLVPVGAYMVVHLTTNASIWNGPAAFQGAVYSIHALGRLLPVVEWGFIFLPLLFHAILGVAIIRGGLPNQSSYPYASNIRYSLQRASGMIAFVFIFYHVFHMHGWFHFDWWLKQVAEPLGGAKFAPYNAASTVAHALQSSGLISFAYLVGVLACVFHLANGIWTMGITWGVWTTPAGQRRATYIAAAIGAVLTVIGVSAWSGFAFQTEDQIQHDRQVEDRMFEQRLASGELSPDDAAHKRASPAADGDGDREPATTEDKDAVGAAGERATVQ